MRKERNSEAREKMKELTIEAHELSRKVLNETYMVLQSMRRGAQQRFPVLPQDGPKMAKTVSPQCGLIRQKWRLKRGWHAKKLT